MIFLFSTFWLACRYEIHEVNEKSDERLDLDGDGFSEIEGDCDDIDPETNPDALELCDSIDNDCDGLIDENLPIPEGTIYFIDEDEDGYGSEVLLSCQDINTSYSTEHGDCNDQNPSIYPTAPDSCADNLDSDCDGFDGSPLCHQHALDFETSISSVSTAPMGTAKYVGDINNDGSNDFIFTGENITGNPVTKLFFGTPCGEENIQDCTFIESTFEFVELRESTVEFVDYDLDGDLDIFITGLSDNGAESILYETTRSNQPSLFKSTHDNDPS